MSDRAVERGVPDDVLSELQETTLTAALLRQRMPGSRQPVAIPGLELLLAGGMIELLDEHLAQQLNLDGLPTPMRRRSRAQLSAAFATSAWQTRYHLAFAAPERENGHIRLRLVLERLSANVAEPFELVSGIEIVFRRDGERWVAASEPNVFVA